MTIDPVTGLPTEDPSAAPQAPPDQPPAEPDYVEFRNRDESWKVPKDLTQQFADAAGVDLDKLRQALQIGMDGTRIYSQINDEREQLRQMAQQLYEAKQAEQRTPATPSGPAYPQTPQSVRRPETATDTVFWIAQQLEAMQPVLGRVSEIERQILETRQTIQDREEERMTIEERSNALQAYGAVQDQWKKEGFGDLPSRDEMESYLRRFPISDDVDMSWADIWNQVGWSLRGPMIFRNARRQAALDARNPAARIVVPASNGMPAGPIPQTQTLGQNASPEELDSQFAAIAKQLGGTTLGDIRP